MDRVTLHHRGCATPGNPGRPKGCRDKVTTALKEAILIGAANVGEDHRP